MEKKHLLIGASAAIFIGNGFDLHLKLATSFDDFFKDRLFKNGMFNNPTNNLLYLLLYLRFYCDTSPQLDFFRKESKSSLNWMDVESFIRKIAVEKEMKDGIYCAYKRIHANRITPHDSNIYPKRRAITSCLAKRSVPIDEGDSIVNQLLYEDLIEFEKDFCAYLKEVDSSINGSERSDFLEVIINNVYQKYTYIPNHFWITSFNYTKINSPYDEYYIHGTLDSKIVIGYDSSSSEIQKNHIFELSKEWQKLSDESPAKISNSVEKLIFYGHSLGEQDYPFFFNIFDQFNLINRKGIPLLVFCYSKYDCNSALSGYDKYRMNIVKMINAYERSHNPNLVRNKLFTYLYSSGQLELLEIKDNLDN